MNISKQDKKHIYIIDSKLICYYLWQRGQSITNLFNKIADLLIQHPKGEVYITFDVGKSSYRLGISPTYKAHRTKVKQNKTPEEQAADLKFQKDYISLIEVAKTLPVTVLAVQGVEADDLVGILTYKFQQDPNNEVYLVTSDMDYVNSVVGFNNTHIIDVFNFGALISHNDVVDKYNLHTRRQFNVWKSIHGDKSDNIKFIKGVAEVKAKEIFDTVYREFQDPTDSDIVEVIEHYLEDKPRLVIHPDHIAVGRETVEQAFNANMLLVDTFINTSLMTREQRDMFLLCMTDPKPLYGSHTLLFDKGIELLGCPIVLNDNATKVFKVK